jgi:hypothetical protein
MSHRTGAHKNAPHGYGHILALHRLTSLGGRDSSKGASLNKSSTLKAVN